MNPRSIRSLVRLSSRPAPFAFELFVDPLLGPGDLEMAGDPSVTLWDVAVEGETVGKEATVVSFRQVLGKRGL